MNYEQIKAYHAINDVPVYHGGMMLDTLKHLSELEGLPEAIKEDYYTQYATALAQVGTSHNKNIGNLIYDKFKGEKPIEIGEVINTFTYKGITFRSIELKMSRFERVFDYFKKVGIPHCHMKASYAVLDIEINGMSTLSRLWEKPNKQHFCPTRDLTFLCDDHEWSIINYYHKPYNGIEANRVVEIFQEACEKAGNDRYASTASVESYINSVLSHYNYCASVEAMLKDVKEIFKYRP